MDINKLTNDYSHVPVPDEQKRSVTRLLAVFMAFTVNVASLILGAQIGAEATLVAAIGGSLIGGLLLFVIGSITAMIGAQTGLGTGMIAKITFGHHGAKLIALIFAFSLFGWFGVQTELFAAGLGELLRSVFDISAPRLVLVIIGGLLMSSTAIIGFKALEKLSLLSLPLLLLIIILPLIMQMINGNMAQILDASAPKTMSMQMVISLVAGSFMAGAVVMPDIMRYAKSRRDAVVTTYLGFALFYPAMLIIAILLAILSGAGDIVQILMMMGMGLPALAIIILATWTTNDSNLYSSSLSLASIFMKTRKWKLAALAGLIGTAFAAFGIMNHFIGWLMLLGLVIAPIGGVIIADYLCRPHAYNALKINDTPKTNWKHLAALIIGIIVGFMASGGHRGGLFTLTTIPPLDGLLIAALTCYGFHRLMPKNSAL